MGPLEVKTIETSRPKETFWKAEPSTRPERKTRTARKKLCTLRLRRCSSSKMVQDAAPQAGTAPDLKADVRSVAVGDALGAGEICRDDGRYEAVIRCVGQRERLLVVSERRDHCDRAKAFFVKGRHSRCHPGDYRRLKEGSLAGAAGQHFRALCNCLGDDPLDIGGLTLVDDRPDLYLLVEGITDDEGLGLSHEGFGIGVSNALLDEVAAGGEADLSLVEEGSPGARAGRGLDVRIVQHNVGIVAAKLERDALELSARDRTHLTAGASRTGEADHVDEGLFDKRCARLRTA